ncbi:hypothetical protein [Stenotrophomonas cyclobalanopsidis]|uniref:hypothetical protein n=1 Tax=Stenotrophomonas cyclobalanopsidis TaxID=2771362 RepID=UPI002FDA89E7
MNADELRKKSEEAGKSSSHAELRKSVENYLDGQASTGARSAVMARELKYPSHSYEALFAEMEKDGFTIEQGSNGLFTVKW